MTKIPSDDDFYVAALWLDVYEGAEDYEACQRVRKWLLSKIEAREFRQACKEAGVSVSHARKALKRNKR